MQGLSPAGFDALIAAAGGRSSFVGPDGKGHNTDWLKSNVVKPQTASRGISFAQLLSERGAGLVGPATTFLSHAYKYCFLTVYDAVVAYEARAPPASSPRYYYYDLCVVNQHAQTGAVDPTVLWEEFAGGVARIANTLLVLTWGSDFAPLTRAWCLAEIVTGVGPRGGAFSIIMPPADEVKFEAALVSDPGSLIEKMSAIDLYRATAYHGGECLVDGVCKHVSSTGPDHIDKCSDDLRWVRDAVTKDLGYDEANKRVVRVVREWMLDAGRRVLCTIAEKGRAASALSLQYATLLRLLGNYGDALPRVEDVLRARRALHGSDHELTLEALGVYAATLREMGRASDALPHSREHMEGSRRRLGDSHPDALSAIDALASALARSGSLHEATPFFLEAMSGRRRVLGDQHPHTFDSMSNYANHLADLGNDESLRFCQQALEGRQRVLGPMHPHTIDSIFNYAIMLKDAGQLEEAERMSTQALQARQRYFGDTHPDTVTSLNNLGLIWLEMGKLSEAMPLIQKELDIQRRIAGNDAPFTFALMSNIAFVYSRMEKHEEALAIGSEALEGRRRVLGDMHPETLRSMNNCAASLYLLKRFSEAAKLCRESLEGRRLVLGRKHPETKKCKALYKAIPERQAAPYLKPTCASYLHHTHTKQHFLSPKQASYTRLPTRR